MHHRNRDIIIMGSNVTSRPERVDECLREMNKDRERRAFLEDDEPKRGRKKRG